MSALKERKLVWEERDRNGVIRLKFAPPEVTPEMRKMIDAAVRSKPMSADEWRVFRMTIPDSHYTWSGKATMFLSPNHHLQQPFVDPTPRDWKRVSIEATGDTFGLRALGPRTKFLPGDRKFYGVPDDLETDGLTMEKAVANGRRLEALIQKKR